MNEIWASQLDMRERHREMAALHSLSGMGLAEAAMVALIGTESSHAERATYRLVDRIIPRVDILNAFDVLGDLQHARRPRKRRLKPPTGPTAKRAKVKAARKARHRMKRSCASR